MCITFDPPQDASLVDDQTSRTNSILGTNLNDELKCAIDLCLNDFFGNITCILFMKPANKLFYHQHRV